MKVFPVTDDRPRWAHVAADLGFGYWEAAPGLIYPARMSGLKVLGVIYAAPQAGGAIELQARYFSHTAKLAIDPLALADIENTYPELVAEVRNVVSTLYASVAP